MKRRSKIILSLIGATVIAAGAAYALVPWRDIAGRQLSAILTARGFENVRLTVADAGLTRATLRDIAVGGETPLTLRDLTVKYDWRELIDGTLRDIAISDIALTVRQTDAGWTVQGLRSAADAPPFTLPVTEAELRARLPFDSITLKNAQLNVVAPSWHATIPGDLSWSRADAYTITAAGKNITYSQGGIDAAAATLSATAQLLANSREWTGEWQAGNITVKSGAPIPPLTGKGSFTAQADHIKLEGQLADDKGKTNARFTATQHFSDAAQNRLTITEATMPWKDGTLRVRNVAIPMGKKSPIRFDLIVDNVSLDELLQAMTGKRVSATGVVSGTVPLVYNPDGTILPGTGALNTAAPGTITMPPDAIPGDNAQIKLTRDILANFHYDNLSITTEKDEGGGTVILLALQGNNPGVYDGRAVKLNVRLTGDVLDFIRNNVILLTTPEKLIQQDQP